MSEQPYIKQRSWEYRYEPEGQRKSTALYLAKVLAAYYGDFQSAKRNDRLGQAEEVKKQVVTVLLEVGLNLDIILDALYAYAGEANPADNPLL